MNSDKQKRTVFLAMLASLVANIIWGISSTFTKIAMESSVPSVLLSWRFVVALIMLSIYALLRRENLRLTKRTAVYIAVMGFFQPVCYFILEEYGILYSSVAFCGIMLSLSPAFSVLMGAVFLREKVTGAQLGFSALSIAGVLIVTIASGGTGIVTLPGFIMLFLGVTFGTAYFIVARHISGETTAFQRTYYMAATGAVVFPIWALLEHWDAPAEMLAPIASPGFLPSVLFLGLFSTFVAYLIMNFASNHLPAARFSAFTNLTTIVTVMAGVLILHEPFLPIIVPTTIMIIVGVWGVQKFTPETMAARKKK